MTDRQAGRVVWVAVPLFLVGVAIVAAGNASRQPVEIFLGALVCAACGSVIWYCLKR